MSIGIETQALAQEIIRRHAEASKEHYQRRQENSARVSASRDQMEGQARSRSDMAQRLRSGLAELRSALLREEARRNEEARQADHRRRQEQRQRNEGVHARLLEHRQDRALARQAWQGVGDTLHPRHAGGVAVAGPPATKPNVPSSTAPGSAGLAERVFDYLASHPDGIRLAELVENKFGLNRFEASRVLRGLLDSGKVEKRDRLYFAI